MSYEMLHSDDRLHQRYKNAIMDVDTDTDARADKPKQRVCAKMGAHSRAYSG